MVGMGLADLESDLPSAGMEHLEHLLSRHNIRLAHGRSRWTGQPVIRIVDATTGRATSRLPAEIGRELAGLAGTVGRF